MSRRGLSTSSATLAAIEAPVSELPGAGEEQVGEEKVIAVANLHERFGRVGGAPWLDRHVLLDGHERRPINSARRVLVPWFPTIGCGAGTKNSAPPALRR